MISHSLFDVAGIVSFSVNGTHAGKVDWTLGRSVFPAISGEHGELDVSVRWMS